jgi:uncharacterized protein (DUF58 family)
MPQDVPTVPQDVRTQATSDGRAMTEDAPLLSGGDVRRLTRLAITAPGAVQAGLIGPRPGPGRSTSQVEFAEHRRYVPGDDPRRIDWGAYGRLRELLVKTTPDPGRVTVSLMLDGSRSMDSGEPSKLRYGRRLTALLGAIALLRSDPVRVQMLADGDAVAGGLLASPGLVAVLTGEIERLPVGTTTELARSVAAATVAGTRVELAVLISDCLVAPADLEAALSGLARAARSATLVQLLDPAEAVAGPLGAAELRDHETGELLRTLVTEQLRDRYAERYAQFRAETEAACQAAGVGYVAADTSADALELLFALASDGALLQGGIID